jgi:hypothetical protein
MRGFWYTLEAAMGVTIILSFLFLLATNLNVQKVPEDLEIKAQELLKDLDDKGLLRSYAVAKNWSGLNSQINYYSHNHTVQICDSEGTCVGSVPEGSNVWVGSYIIAGDSGYNPLVVKLYLYR